MNGTKAEREFKALGVIGAVKFPVVTKQVVKGSGVYVTIIYRNRSEQYKLVSRFNETEAKKQDVKFDPYSELEMELGNGGKIIRGGDY